MAKGGVLKPCVHIHLVAYIYNSSSKSTFFLQKHPIFNLQIQINRNLEELARLIYDYWFVQFDFPDNNGKPYKSSGGKMVWNKALKRKIPEGWNVNVLNYFVDTCENGEWGADEESEKNNIKVGCVRGADIEDLTDLPIRFISKNSQKKLLKEFDIIVEISGGSPTQATGRSNFVSSELLERNGGNVTCSNFCKSLRLKEGYMSSYFFMLWQKLYKWNYMFNHEGKTSGLKNLMIDSVLETKWSIPPKDLMVKYHSFFQKALKQQEFLKTENKNLSDVRDFLLPLLMNGQVSLRG